MVQQNEISFMRLIHSDLERVRRVLRQTCSDVSEPIRPLVEHGALDCGKLLRPAFLLLSGRALGAVTQDHILAATSLELIHNASLLHDDVLDRGLVRRGVATANQRWGNQAAVLFGDLLLGKALGIIAALPEVARSVLNRTIQRTCDGEMHQVVTAGSFTLTEQQYLSLVTEKTAAMFEGACRLGAELAGASEGECLALSQFGCHAGIAYQIADDLLDVIGDGEALCKTLGTDLQRGKLTLPLIHSIRVLAEPGRSSLLRKLERRCLTRLELFDILAEAGSTDYVLARLDGYARQAIEAIAPLRQSLAKAGLLQMPHWISQQVAEQIRAGPANALVHPEGSHPIRTRHH
jgi:octaprenyl-diphosphate synthase